MYLMNNTGCIKVASPIKKRKGLSPGLVVCTHLYPRFQDTSDVMWEPAKSEYINQNQDQTSNDC